MYKMTYKIYYGFGNSLLLEEFGFGIYMVKRYETVRNNPQMKIVQFTPIKMSFSNFWKCARKEISF